MKLKDKGKIGDCVCGDEYDNECTAWYREQDIKDSISKIKDEIIENDIYTADEIFRIINTEFAFCEESEQ